MTYSPGQIVESTAAGNRLVIARVDRQPHITHYYLRGIPQPYTESQLRPPPPEPKEIKPMTMTEVNRMLKGKRR